MNTDNDDKIVYLPRLWEMIKSNYKNNKRKKEDKILNLKEIKEKVEEYIDKASINKFELSQIFVNEIKEFFEEKIKIIEESLKIFGNMKKNVINNIWSISQIQLDDFFKELWIKYKKIIQIYIVIVLSISHLSWKNCRLGTLYIYKLLFSSIICFASGFIPPVY